MTESIASWLTLAALIASIGWYIYQNRERTLSNLVTAVMSGILCLFGGLLFSGAILKLAGSFDNALIPALLVCFGTALCIALHRSLQRRKTAQE